MSITSNPALKAIVDLKKKQRVAAEAEEALHDFTVAGLDELAQNARLREWQGLMTNDGYPIRSNKSVQWVRAASGAWFSLPEIISALIAMKGKV